jgi:hypothetical protein
MNPRHITRFVLIGSLLAGLAGCNSHSGKAPVALADLPAAATAGAASAQPAVLEDEMRSDLYFLASDRLEGRGVGTEGLDLAADYIATRFESLGLKPLPGLNGYFQPFDIVTAESISPATSLSAGDSNFEVKKDFIPASFSAEKEFAGPVVFAGYGITNKEEKYDDYAGLDVKGKIVLMLRFEPHDPTTGKSRWANDEYTEHSHLNVKAANAQAHGAAAILLVNPPKYHFTAGDPLMTFARQPSDTLSIPFVQVTQKTANELLKSAGAENLTALQDHLDETLKPESFDLKGVDVKGKVAINRTRKTVKNVVAYLPGVGPHADEYVVIGAHYDHLGWGGPGSLMNAPAIFRPLPSAHPTTTRRAANPHAPTTRAIHHGADDNASGTTTVLELARIFAHRQKSAPPSRSIIFCSFTAEEEGLIGSARWVNHPPVDLKKIVAMLNLDMVGRIRKNLLYVGGGGTASPFHELLKKADEDSPLEFKSFGEGGLGPSDHMSFALKKVPVIFLFSGNHEDYHRPTDTADKINFDGMVDVVKMSTELIEGLEQMPQSKYVDAADKGSMLNPMTAGTGGDTGGVRRASLGVVPVYDGSEEDGKGVKIGGTSAGTPAEKAGLKGGDVVLKLGDKPTGTLMELSAVLASHKPGDKVKLVYRRGEKVMTADVTLAGRGGQ